MVEQPSLQWAFQIAEPKRGGKRLTPVQARARSSHPLGCCYPLCLPEHLNPAECTLYECCASLLWFKERILVFLWKPLFFRWPGDLVTSPVTLGCIPAFKRSAVTEGVRVGPHITHLWCFRLCITYHTTFLGSFFSPLCFLMAWKQQDWFS